MSARWASSRSGSSETSRRATAAAWSCMPSAICRPSRAATVVRRLAAELAARDNWTRQQLVVYQREQLQTVLRHAVNASPYYRETIGHLVAHEAPLEEFPVLTKSQLVANFDRIVTDRRLNL